MEYFENMMINICFCYLIQKHVMEDSYVFRKLTFFTSPPRREFLKNSVEILKCDKYNWVKTIK